MALSTNTQFAVAVHVLTYLADPPGPDGDRPVSSEELSASTGANPVHVRRVLGPLRRAGLLTSRPGVRGGWRLAADPRATTLAQVWSLLQCTDPVLGLHGPNPACPVGRTVQASLTVLDHAVAGAVAGELARFTIADLASGAVAPPASRAE